MSFGSADYDLVQNAIGYTFSRRDLLVEALDTTGMRTIESNQLLAMLGDALLKMILLDDWCASGRAKGTFRGLFFFGAFVADTQGIGQGNNLVSTIGSNANLASTARDAGLDKHVILHPGHRGSVSEKTLATTVEAILRAIYLDSEKNTESVSRAMILIGLKDSI